MNGRGSLSFEYLSPLSIQRVYPTVGLVSTAFMVSVQADGLMQTAICKVNDVEFICLLHSPYVCRCVLLIDTPGTKQLHFALSERQFFFVCHLETVKPYSYYL